MSIAWQEPVSPGSFNEQIGQLSHVLAAPRVNPRTKSTWLLASKSESAPGWNNRLCEQSPWRIRKWNCEAGKTCYYRSDAWPRLRNQTVMKLNFRDSCGLFSPDTFPFNETLWAQWLIITWHCSRDLCTRCMIRAKRSSYLQLFPKDKISFIISVFCVSKLHCRSSFLNICRLTHSSYHLFFRAQRFVHMHKVVDNFSSSCRDCSEPDTQMTAEQIWLTA